MKLADLASMEANSQLKTRFDLRVAEFTQLRQEIIKRMELRHQTVFAVIIAAASLFTVGL